MALNVRLLGLAVLGPVLLACSRRETPGPRARPDSAEAAASAPRPRREQPPIEGATALAEGASGAAAASRPLLPALSTSEPMISLEVPGFGPASVSVPSGATRPMPVALALHGNFDRPEWQCEVWRGVLRERGFILCPRGVARRDVPKSADRWEYASLKAVEAEVLAGLSSLRERFGEYVDPGPVLFIGFSLGAIYGSPLVRKFPEQFSRVVLVEGGQGGWTRPSATAFVKGGGLRLLIACGQSGCLSQGKNLSRSLEKAGLPTHTVGSPKAGHTYDGEVAQAVAGELSWLLEGDPRWEGP